MKKHEGCGCKPGTYENGWMEQRSQECIEKELAAWAGLRDMARIFTGRITLDKRTERR